MPVWKWLTRKKRQRLAEPAGSSSSIVRAQVTPVAVVVAPKGGSLDQEQVDALVKHGVTQGITGLAKFPSESSSSFCGQLLTCEPNSKAQKGLICKIVNEWVTYTHRVAIGQGKAVAYYWLSQQEKEAVDLVKQKDTARKQKEEEDAQDKKESDISIAKDKQHAHPWVSFFQRPISASEWTAPVLHSFCEQREGLRLMLDGTTGLEVKLTEL